MRVCDAALLWTGEGVDHGFGERARTHAGIAMRAAADAWPVLDRLLELRVPDQIVLDSDELVSLLDEGVAALAARGVDVMWPRSLGRDLTATAVLDRRAAAGAAVREEPLQTGVLNRGGAVRLQLAARPPRRPADAGGDGRPRPRRLADPPAARPVGGRRPRPRPQGAQSG